MTNNITIPRELASELLGEMEVMVELIHGECGDNREGCEIIDAGDMPECYYELRDAFWLRFFYDNMTKIERD